MRWDGSAWSLFGSLPDRVLNSVAMVSANDGWAVGDYCHFIDIYHQTVNSVIMHWNGSSWNEISSPDSFNERLNSVAMLSATDGWAVGDTGTIRHWNGSVWSLVSSPTYCDLKSVAMVSAEDGWAVGGDNYCSQPSVILHWNGNTWSEARSPVPETLNSVAMISANEGWAVGEGGTILEYDVLPPVPPHAAFDAAPTMGPAPLTVHFTDTSTGDYNALLWNFGDGGLSAQTTPTHTYTTGGVYTVSLTVSGLGGTDTVTHTNFITVYTSVPGVPILLAPPDGTLTTTQAITFAWQAGAGETLLGYNVKVDGNIITTTNTTSATVLSNGTHTWTARAYNAIGYSAWATTWTVSITQPVGVPTLVAPPDGNLTLHNVTFAWQAGAGSAPAGYNLQVDGSVITTTNTTSATVLSNGIHTWTARAYNAVGYSAWVTPAWTVEVTDTLPIPGVPILLAPPSGTITTSRAITFAWQSGAGGVPQGYNVQVDSGEIITVTGAISTTLLSEGVHTWTVRAYNAVGYSEWATPWSVEVRLRHVYLPLALRNQS